MDIKDLQRERKETEEEIRSAIQTIVEKFAKKTGLPIENVFVNMSFEPSEVDGQKIYSVDGVTCEVHW